MKINIHKLLLRSGNSRNPASIGMNTVGTNSHTTILLYLVIILSAADANTQGYTNFCFI